MMLAEIIGARRRRKSSPGGTVPPDTPRFRATGGRIYSPTGDEFVPIGANVGTVGGFDWKGTATGHAADAAAWGWNCIRLTFLATDQSSFSWLRTHTGGVPALLDYLDTIVREYVAQGIVVMLEAHDDPKAWADVAAVEQEMVDFWAAAAARWKDNPWVWFNPINEPKYQDDPWVILHDRFCAAIRGAGALAPIVCDAPGAGQDAASVWIPGARYAYDPTMAPVLNARWGDIISSNHNYGAKWDNYTKTAEWIANTRAAGLTPIFGEFGYTIDGTTTAGSYQKNYDAAQAVMQAYTDLDVGILWWHGTHGDNYSLKLNGKAFWDGGPGAALSDAGTKLWALGHPGAGAPSAVIPQTIPYTIGA